MNLKTCVLLSAVLYASPVLATPIISVAPRAGDPTIVGQPVRVDVSIAGVTDLIGFEFDLSFDENLLSPSSLEPGSALTSFDPSLIFFTALQDTTVTPGTIAFVTGALFDPAAAQDGVLATFTFNPIAAGTSLLTLSNVTLQDLASFENNEPLLDFTVDEPGSLTIAASTDVTPVPEPATILLVGTGLAAALRKHRARSSN